MQHKNIAETLLSDLETLDAMLSMQGSMMPETDFRPMISEWTGEVAKEIDFTLEARKRVCLRHLYINSISLPRQTRDKHRLGKTQKRDAFLIGGEPGQDRQPPSHGQSRQHRRQQQCCW